MDVEGDYNKSFYILRDAFNEVLNTYENSTPPIEVLNNFLRAGSKYLKVFHQCSKEEWETSERCTEWSTNRHVLITLISMAYEWRAQMKFEKHDAFGAKSDWEESIKISNFDNPGNLFDSERFKATYYNIGLCEFNMQNYEKACYAWSKAGELGYEKAYEMIKEHCYNYSK